jgi:hypothetical protein
MADADPSDEEEEEHALGEDGGELLELCEQLHQQALARRVAMNAREAPHPPEFQPTQGGSTLARRLDKASSPCVYTDAPLAMALVMVDRRVDCPGLDNQLPILCELGGFRQPYVDDGSLLAVLELVCARPNAPAPKPSTNHTRLCPVVAPHSSTPE